VVSNHVLDRFAQTVLPLSISQWLVTQLYHVAVGKLPAELQPEHGLLEANPTIRSDFVENVKLGRITAHRTGVDQVTPTGLRLTNGVALDVDVIILCTGYRVDYPVIPEKFYRSEQSEFLDSPNSVQLYKLTVPPQYPTLFIMGIFELPGPFHPAVELQARWASAVLAGRIKLPSAEQMSKAIRESEQTRAQHVSVYFHPRLWRVC
jgi:dimethylaniline monooxygenase (N-oxide forming)